MIMKRVSLNIKREVACLDLINTKVIDNSGNTPVIHFVCETVSENIFIELFHDANLDHLFAQKIFSLN